MEDAKQSLESESSNGDPDAEFWSQVKSEDSTQQVKEEEGSVDSYGDALNKASNEDIYAFSEVASSDMGVTSYLKNVDTEPTI